MKRILVLAVLAFAILLGMLTCLRWLQRSTEDDAAGRMATGTPSTSPTSRPPTSSTPALEQAPVAARPDGASAPGAALYQRARSAPDAPSFTPRDRLLAEAETVTFSDGPPDAKGRFERVSLLKVDFKYPLLRAVSSVRLDPGTGEEVVQPGPVMVADHILVKLQDGATDDDLRAVNQRHGASIRKVLFTPGLYLVAFPAPDVDLVPTQIEVYARETSVIAYAEPDYIGFATATLPNDPRFADCYGLHNTGQTGGSADADIDATEAWDLATGDGSFVVGVIDTGIDYHHEDLVDNMWTNPGEVPGNGVDDDGNGFVDDVYGWDFANDDSDPWDDGDHGTHVSGTIAAAGNNGIGVAGVNWTARLMALKWILGSGFGTESDAVDCVTYATMMRRRGIDIRLTNNSWRNGGYSQSLYDALVDSESEGILFVCSAGNDGMDTDLTPHYPSTYDLDSVISVASTTHDDSLSSFSNYGLTTVDLGAPGSDVLSTVPNDSYAYYNGTSMASPHVAGVAALIWAMAPNATFQEVRTALLDGVDPVPALAGRCITGGRLNARQSLEQLGMLVRASFPANNSIVDSPPAAFTVEFSDPYAPASVEASDLRVNGIPAEESTLTSTTVVTFVFPTSPVTAEGSQTLEMTEDAVMRAGDGDGVKAWNATFRYDALRLAVTGTLPADGGTVLLPLTTLRVDFNEPIDPASVGLDDLVLSQGEVAGAVTVGVDAVEYTLANVNEEGALAFSFAAGALADVHGNPSLPYTGALDLDFGTVPVTQRFDLVKPAGSLVYAADLTGRIHPAADADTFVLDLDPNQLVTVDVNPGSTLQPALTLRDPSNTIVGTATAAAPGEHVLVQAVSTVVPGSYVLELGGTGSTTGGYVATVHLNAGAEVERYGGPVNDTILAAEDLDPLFLPLGSGVAKASVLGDPGLPPAVPPITSETEPNDDGTAGISSSDLRNANNWSGSFVEIGPELYGASLQGEISEGNDGDWDIFRVNASPGDTMVIDLKGSSSGRGTLPDPYLYLYSSRAVQLASNDDWNGLDSRIEYSDFPYNGPYFIVADGLGSGTGTYTLEATTTSPLNGIVPSEDWFSFSLASNEVVDLVLSGTGRSPSLELYDGADLVATGAERVGQGYAIAGFPSPSNGTYAVRLAGSTPYHLVVTRQAAFAQGRNTSPEAAQDITTRPHALGRVAFSDGRLFALPLDNTSYIVELDVGTGEEIRRIPAPEPAGGPDCLAYSGSSLYLYHAWGSQILWELDPDTGAVLDADPMPPAIGSSDGMTELNGLLYILDFGNDDIAVFDPITDTVLRVMDIDTLNPGTSLVGGLAAIAEPQALVATVGGGARIVEIDPITGLVGAEFAPGTPAEGDYISLAVIDQELHLGAYTQNTLDVFARDGTFLRGLPMPYGISGLASAASGGGAAWFSVRVNRGDDLVVSTLTPGDGPLAFENLLDPALFLYRPDGSLVSSNDNAAADGRNAELAHSASTSGTYRVEVAPALETEGEYLVSVSGATGNPEPFKVAATQPADGALLGSSPRELVIDFNAPITPASLVASDLLVDGLQDALSVTLVDGDTVMFELPPYVDGLHTFSLPAGAVSDLAGTPLTAFDMTVLLDLTPPRVVFSSVQEDGIVAPTGLTFVARFSEPLRANLLEVSDLVLEGPTAGTVVPTGFIYESSNSTLTVTFPDLGEDEYTLTLRSGAGAFEDLAGHALDGETPLWPIPPNVSGDGVDGGDFSVGFVADVNTAAWTAPFGARRPLGALVYEARMQTLITPADDTDRYVVELDSGQHLAAIAQPLDDFLPYLEVSAPDGSLLGSATAAFAGGSAAVSGLPIVSSGTYTVTVSSAYAGGGRVRLQLLLNAAVEAESTGGAANDSPAAAEELEIAGASLGGTVLRSAVAGSPAVPMPAPPILTETEPNDDGETGGSAADLPFANDWSGSFAALGGGRYHAVLAGEVSEGNDAGWDFFRVLASPGDTLEISLMGSASGRGTLSDPYLRLYDETGNQIASDDDGGNGLESLLVYSDFAYGGSYYVVAESFGSSTGTYTLEATHTTDNVLLPLGPGEDWFRFDLAASDEISLVLGAGGVGDLALELYGPDGTTLETIAEPSLNHEGVINGFRAPAPGTYHARVAGKADYNLVLLRDAWFEEEPNDDFSQAPTVPGESRLVGHFSGGELGRLYVYDATAALIRELDPVTGAFLNAFPSPAADALGPDFGMATSPDGLLVGGASASPVYLLHPGTGGILRSLPNPGLDISGMAYLNREVFLLTDSSGDITVIDYADGSVLRELDVKLPISECLGAYRDGLLSLLANLLISVDPVTGAASELQALDASGEGLGVIGDELFIAGYNSVGAFDLETLELNRILDGLENLEALGADGGSESRDLLRIDVTAGDLLTLATATPGDGPYEPENTLDPMLELYNPAGTMVAWDDNGLDGRNASITHTAQVSGLYTVGIASSNKAPGEFILEVSGATGTGPDFRVTASDPANADHLATCPASVEFTFSGNVMLSSADAGDLEVNHLPATAVTAVDNRTLRFDLPVVTDGVLDVSLGGGVLTSLTGQPVEPFAASYTVQGPRLVNATVQQGDVLEPGAYSFDFVFDREMDGANLDASDVLLEGVRGGPIDGINAWYDPYASSSVLRVAFEGLEDDDYTLTLFSGDGRIEDVIGYDLDGEPLAFPIPTNTSGDGIAGGDFAVRFSVDGVLEPLPEAFVPRPPAGSRVYQTAVRGMIQHDADVDAFTLDVEPGQTLTVYADTQDALAAGLSLDNDFSGAPPVISEDGLIQTEPVPMASTWTLFVWGAGGSTGAYEVTVLLNAAVEEEARGVVPDNDTSDHAQDLAGSSIPVAGGEAGRYAVSGSLPVLPGAYRVLHEEHFDRGVLGSAWTTSASDPGGRIRVSDAMGAAHGGFALLMDRDGSGADNLNEAVWAVDLEGEPEAVLTLQHAEWYDEDHPFAGDFTGSADADGVAISDDGVNWHPVLDAPAQPSRRWFPHSIDLVQAAADAGMTLSSGFRIKLQQFDNGSMPLDGRGWDTLQIVAPLADVDWYAVELDAQQAADFVVAAPTGTAISVDLFAADGESLLAHGASSQPGLSVIEGYVASMPGTCLVRVSGVADEYDLVVTRDICFDIEPNELPETMPDLGRTGRAMGHVGAGEDDGLVYEALAGDNLSVIVSTPFRGPPGVDHGLMPGLALVAPSGVTQEVANASTSGVASISHVASADGLYTVQVGSVTNAGEYELAVTGATVVAVSDLVVWHEHQPGRSRIGCLPHFVVAVSNAGPKAAAGAVLTYDIDPAMRLVSSEATQGTVSEGQGVVWDIAMLAAGQSAFLDIGVVMGQEGNAANTATVSANEADPNSSNNVDVAWTSVVVARPSSDQEGSMVYGTPVILDPPVEPDQNRVGESLDLDTSGGFLLSTNTCTYGGRIGFVYFNYDETNLYVGGHAVDMLDKTNRIVLFLGLNTLSDDLRNTAGKSGDPATLNLLDNLFLENPMDLAIVLGDEHGDGTDASAEHGVFRLGGPGFQPVADSRLAQFDGSAHPATLPTLTPDDDGDRFTDRWEAAIPWSALNAPSGVVSITSLRVAGVVVGADQDSRRYIHSSYLGASADGMTDVNGNYGYQDVYLRGLPVGLPDRDGDGLPDWWETLHGLDPDDDGSVDPDNGPDGDPDGDDATNAEEQGTGTDPRDAASVFAIADVTADAAGAEVTVLTQPGQRYEIEYRDGMSDGAAAWIPFANGIDGVGTWIEDAAAPTNFTFVDDFTPATSGAAPTGMPLRVYRVNTEER